MFDFIMFGDREQNIPNLCYHIGFDGCKSITEIIHEPINKGIECASYKIEFDDGESTIIDKTILVSA